MDQQALSKLKQTFSQAESLGIIVGQNSTVDEMGAALALYLSLKSANKKVSIASPTEPIVELSSLVGIDQVRNSLGGGAAGDLVVSFPYKEGEIEKVSYTLENNQLNIVVKAGELGLNFSDDDVSFTHGSGGIPTVIVTVGVSHLRDVESILTDEMKDVQIINIDSNASNQGYGDIVLVTQSASSVSEIMSELLLSANMPLDVDIAQNLLSGISVATANFQDPKTSFLAFEMVGELMRLGAVRMPVVTPNASQLSSIPQPRAQVNYPAMNSANDFAGGAQSQQPRAPQVHDRGQQRGAQNQNRDSQIPGRGQQISNRASHMPDRGQQGSTRGQRPFQGGGQRGPQQAQQSRAPHVQDRGQQAPDRQNRVTQGPQTQPEPRMVQQPRQANAQDALRMRQDQIREELARAASQNPATQNFQDEPMNTQTAPIESGAEPQIQESQPTNGRSKNPPADWLTPKVYKGSSDVNN